jgi:hypothetical protein
MYLVAFLQQQFRQVGAVLSCDAGDQSFLHAIQVPVVVDMPANITDVGGLRLWRFLPQACIVVMEK